MAKSLWFFYSSLIILVALGPKGCEEEKINNQEKITNQTELDVELQTLLERQSDKGLSYYILPESSDYASIPQDPKNPINSFKVLLGKKLFCEPALAIHPKDSKGKNEYTCASCHIAESAFGAGVVQGIGEGGQGYGQRGEKRKVNTHYIIDNIDVQPIRTPSIINGAYNRTAIWNGQFGAVGPNDGTQEQWKEGTPIAFNHLGFEGLETQAIAGMEVHRLAVDETFIVNNYYKEWFDLAFPDVPEEERYSQINAGLAMAAFERTVLANNAPFQKWLKGDESAMSNSQKKGALLFFGKAQCSNCHNGPALNSEDFHALGMNDFSKNQKNIIINNEKDFIKAKKGRGGFTQKEEDFYKFKTPQLYGLKTMGFYGHGASFSSIQEIIEYKNQGIPQNKEVSAHQLAKEFKALHLSKEEIMQLTDFIENALYDDTMNRFIPTSVASGMCFPNNDSQSVQDMNCK